MEVIFYVVPAVELQIGYSGVSEIPKPLGFYGSCLVNYILNIYLHYFWKNIISQSFLFEKSTSTVGEEEARLAGSLALAMIVQHLVITGLGRSEVHWKSIWGEDKTSRSPLPSTEYTFGPVAYCPSLVSFQILYVFPWPQQTPHSHRSSVLLFCVPSHILFEVVK